MKQKMKQFLTAKINRILSKKTNANVVDQLGTVFMVAFSLGLIVMFACYTKITETVMRIDSCCLTYLNVMEQQGYLPTAYLTQFEKDLEDLGVVSATLATTPDYLTGEQASYGSVIALKIEVDIKNPIYYLFAEDRNPKSWLRLSGLSPTLHYNPPAYTSTSKW